MERPQSLESKNFEYISVAIENLEKLYKNLSPGETAETVRRILDSLAEPQVEMGRAFFKSRH